jgi:hypothetical protein
MTNGLTGFGIELFFEIKERGGRILIAAEEEIVARGAPQFAEGLPRGSRRMRTVQ